MSIVQNKTDVDEKDPHICGMPTQVFSRVCGYYRPVSNWNWGKKEEFKERLTFNVQNHHYVTRTTGCGCN